MYVGTVHYYSRLTDVSRTNLYVFASVLFDINAYLFQTTESKGVKTITSVRP